ncbi:hypothetical protein [Arthrobacter sp. Leaf137]|uniref:hypothetical protein n=1 Tax=Arthrobacter sp. Leaf137 TaxID=1736271 RepID=UPI0012E148C5|nr:hypothetical protein [Arthrobacter sp. Leaf137]
MSTRNWSQPTKDGAVIMGLVAVMWLANNLYAVLAEGSRATVWYWIIQVMNLGLLGFSFWWYRRAAKKSPRQSES